MNILIGIISSIIIFLLVIGATIILLTARKDRAVSTKHTSMGCLMFLFILVALVYAWQIQGGEFKQRTEETIEDTNESLGGSENGYPVLPSDQKESDREEPYKIESSTPP